MKKEECDKVKLPLSLVVSTEHTHLLLSTRTKGACCRVLFKNVKKPAHFNPLKTPRPASTGNYEITHSPGLQHQRSKKKIYLFTTLTVPVFGKSLYQNKVDNLQKPISGLGRIVFPLIFFMNEFPVHAAQVVWYDFRSIYRQAFSAVVGITPAGSPVGPVHKKQIWCRKAPVSAEQPSGKRVASLTPLPPCIALELAVHLSYNQTYVPGPRFGFQSS